MLSLKNWPGRSLLLFLFLSLLVGCEPPRLTPTRRPAPTPLPQTPAPAPQTLTGTSWQLVEMNANTDSSVRGVTAHFHAARLIGWTSCNSYASEYTLGDGVFKLNTVLLTTANSCPAEGAAMLEQEYLATLGQATAYRVEGVDLKLSDSSGQIILRFRSLPAMQLNGASWVLSAYQNDQGQLTPLLPAGPALSATFTDGVIRGFGGCANYTGNYTLFGASVTIAEVRRVAVLSADARCVAGGELRSQEDAFLAALPQAQTALFDGAQLTLTNSQGEPVAVFTFVTAR